MARVDKKRLGSEGDISLGGGRGAGVSIGSVLCRGEGEIAGQASGKTKETPAVRAGAADDSDKITAAIIRRESAGRGGRTVTSVELRPEPDARRAGETARSLSKGLGCGSHVEGHKIILQGDMGERAATWLKKQGVKKITHGS
jgi:translation initiation factor 1 (eIF-1/SUI1)